MCANILKLSLSEMVQLCSIVLSHIKDFIKDRLCKLYLVRKELSLNEFFKYRMLTAIDIVYTIGF